MPTWTIVLATRPIAVASAYGAHRIDVSPAP
jgi:hypothetical protein